VNYFKPEQEAQLLQR